MKAVKTMSLVVQQAHTYIHIFCFIHSSEGRAVGHVEVPSVALVLPAGGTTGVCLAVWIFGRTPPPSGPPPAGQTWARRWRDQQNKEGPTEPDGFHRAPAYGPGEKIREAEIPLNPWQVRPCRTGEAMRKHLRKTLNYIFSNYLSQWLCFGPVGYKHVLQAKSSTEITTLTKAMHLIPHWWTIASTQCLLLNSLYFIK